MEPRKLNVLFTFFPYSGSGGVSSEHPNIRNWMVKTALLCKGDPRIGDLCHKDFCDTPITMTRNAAVEWARKCGADILVMIDSDQHPDILLGTDPTAKPFFETAFNHIYENWEQGPRFVFAPYCGPPPYENVYVFRWANWNTHRDDHDARIEAFTREEAAQRTGLEPVAAGPTGCIMYDVRCFDHIDRPYFYYEYKGDGLPCDKCGCRTPGPQAEKASTEDVTNTRDLSIHIARKLGYNPCIVAWDCWAGHYKPLCVSKPQLTSISQVSKKYADAVLRGQKATERVMMVGEAMPEFQIESNHTREERIQILSQTLFRELGGALGLADALNKQYRSLLGSEFMDGINRQIQEELSQREFDEAMKDIAAKQPKPQRTPEQEEVRNRVLSASQPATFKEWDQSLHERAEATDCEYKAEKQEDEDYRKHVEEFYDDEDNVGEEPPSKKDFQVERERQKRQREEEDRREQELAQGAKEPGWQFGTQRWYPFGTSDDEFRKAVAAAPPGSQICRVLTPI